MKILVTGATGFLGGATVRRLLRDGFSVTATGRNRLAGATLCTSGLRFEIADLEDEILLDRLVAGHDIVVHCAALSSPWGPAAAFERTNIQGTHRLVDICLRHRVPGFIFISSPSIYFDYRDRLDISETDLIARRPVNAYAASKMAAERIVREASSKGLKAAILRPRALHGDGDTTLLPRLLRIAKRGFLPLIHDGKAQIDLTYIDNAVDAILKLIHQWEEFDGGEYNISNGDPISVRNLFEFIVHSMGRNVILKPTPYYAAYTAAAVAESWARLSTKHPEPKLTRYAVGLLAFSQTFSIEAAVRDFGYHPAVSTFDGLARTFATRAGHDD